ncbi:MAG: ATP-binding protein, partial [Acidobacteriota bacterium]
LTLLRPLVGTKNLQLASQLAPNLPPVLADEHRLQQILHNLVGNAIKFTEAGEIEVGAERRGDRLRVSVRDTGIGIAEEQQGRIFEAFVQADGSTDRELGGTGLGLAVTGQLVELHNSQLQLDSALGEGSTFWFDLPIAESRPAATPSVEERPPSHVPVLAPSAAASPEGSSIVEGNTESVALQGSTEAHSPSIILVVDDEPVNRQVLVNQLAGEGYHVVQAASGGEALEWLEENTPDLLLLDVMMPRMSGYEVCRTLRQRFEPGELPVLFLTAKNRSSDSVAGFDVGANDYLPKPISKSELLARVTTHLALRTVNRQLSDLVVERTTEVARRERLIEALETKNAELERFNYSVAHDLKNPLVTIMNYLGLARRDAAAGEAERLGQHFDRLQTAADKLHLQLEDLFELSRVGLQPQAIEIVPFGEVVQGALGILAPQIRESGAALTVADELPTVRGDRQQIQELLRQLVDNALRHVVAGRSPRIEVGVRPGEGGGNSGSIFYVRDDGPGIEAKFQTRIFELFERLEPDAFPGTGIGLALAKRIVEAHGGRIWVESEGLGHGSTFCFTTGRDLD